MVLGLIGREIDPAQGIYLNRTIETKVTPGIYSWPEWYWIPPQSPVFK